MIPENQTNECDPSLPARTRHSQWFRSPFWIVVMSGFVMLVMLILTIIFLHPFDAPQMSQRTRALKNAKQIGMALFNFEQDYGKYPDACTIEAVRKKPELPCLSASAPPMIISANCLPPNVSIVKRVFTPIFGIRESRIM